MKQEDKELLLIDLSERLPYGVHCCVLNLDETIKEDNDIIYGIVGGNIVTLKSDKNECYMYYQIKPYLRPMSSMTEEEKLHIELTYGFFYHDRVLDNVHIFEAGGTYDRDGNYEPLCEYRQEKHVTIEQVIDFIHWLNTNHFDYRGLIEKGLALEAPEGMYNLKE